MNAIDTAAENTVLGLANGWLKEIPAGQQGAVLDWAVKTALVRMLFDRHIPREDTFYRQMAETRTAPERAIVQMARAERAAYAAGSHVGLSVGPHTPQDGTPEDLHFVTLGLGCLSVMTLLPAGPLASSMGNRVLRVAREQQKGHYLVLDRSVSTSRSVGRPGQEALTFDESRIASKFVLTWADGIKQFETGSDEGVAEWMPPI